MRGIFKIRRPAHDGVRRRETEYPFDGQDQLTQRLGFFLEECIVEEYHSGRQRNSVREFSVSNLKREKQYSLEIPPVRMVNRGVDEESRAVMEKESIDEYSVRITNRFSRFMQTFIRDMQGFLVD